MGTWAEEMWMRADALIDRGRMIEARRVLEEIIEEEPGYGRAHAYLGWYEYSHLSNFEAAEVFLRHAVMFSPEFVVGYRHYLFVLRELRRWETLVEVAERAETVPGMNAAMVYEYRAAAAEGMGSYRRAIEMYTRAAIESSEDWNRRRYREHIRRIRRTHSVGVSIFGITL